MNTPFTQCAIALLVLARALSAAPPEYTYKVVHIYPHDREAFTQGLEFRNGFLYEGTGLNGRSTLRKEKLETGQVLRRIDLASEYFGEGITVLHSKIYQLTWQSHIGFIYNEADFHLIRKFSYSGEGWGLTNNGRELFLSDGTSEIRVLNPDTLAEKRRISVRDGNKPVDQLNELEWVDGELFANIWQTDRIARVSPKNGTITGWIDLAGILGPMYRPETGGVLNGIAYSSVTKRLFVTGKLWPSIFEIQLTPKK